MHFHFHMQKYSSRENDLSKAFFVNYFAMLFIDFHSTIQDNPSMYARVIPCDMITFEFFSYLFLQPKDKITTVKLIFVLEVFWHQ
mmetsp:Transcript_1201/g.2134  ORF Transcript_1201/g.2134 Transcript_1201/m.2134 type:complete len:85 (-) Transcript_1201:836-1090(-)